MKIHGFCWRNIATLAAMCLGGAFQSVVLGVTWNGIMLSGEAVEYYQYTNGTRTEVSVENSSQAQLQITSRPAFTYAFALIPGPKTTQRSVCQIVNQTDSGHPVYWYSNGTDSATSIAGQYPSSDPAQFHESRNVTGVKGVEFLGTFSTDTSLSGGHAYETVYFTDRHCTDGGREFGFFRDLSEATNRVVFYTSDFSNCTIGGTVFCRKTANASAVWPSRVSHRASIISEPI